MTDIATFLDSLGLSKYTRVFIDNDIDLHILGKMSESHFKELGMSMGHRLLLMESLAGESAPASSEQPLFAEVTSPEPDAFTALGERRQLSVMFIDLVGSTALSERFDPEDLGDIVRAYQKICAGIVNRFQATIAKYSGDGILVYFGYPTAHENDVERALRAGLEIIDAFRHRELRPGLVAQLRIGVATGLVVVGETIGENSSEEQVVLGETPNLAARLQSLAEPDTMVVSDRSHQLAVELFDFTDLGETALKGFSTDQHCWRVDSIRVKTGHQATPMLSATTQFLGRDEEFQLLLKRWRWSSRGEGQTVLIGGEAGIGKSRLVAELNEYLNDQGSQAEFNQLYHYCSDYHQNTFLYAVIDQWLYTTKALEYNSLESSGKQLQTSLANTFNLEGDDLSLIAELLGIPVENEGGFSSLSQQFKQNRTMEVLVELYTSFASNAPLLLIFEDIQWADPSTLELIGRLINVSSPLPIMLLLTSRSEFESAWMLHPNVTRFSLSRLPDNVSNDLVEDICGPNTLSEELVKTITVRADGIPLFVEELTKTVISYADEENGLSNGKSGAPAMVPANEIPASLQDSLLARLDRQASARRVAQIGSALGREFDYTDLKTLVDIDEQKLGLKLEELIQSELILSVGGSPPEASYRFKHSLVREAAYDSMLKSVRRQLHRRIAEQMQKNEQRVQRSPEIIAEHWDRAENSTRAAEFWFLAGKNSKARYALAEAGYQLSRVIDIAEEERCASNPEIANTAAKALGLLGDIAGLNDDADEANRLYDHASRLCNQEETRVWIQNKKHIPRTTIRDNATLAYDIHGSGDQTIFLATAMIYGLGSLQPALEELCQDYRVITIHTRGCGKSDPIPRHYPITEHAEDFAAIIRSESDGPVIAVGLSRASNTLIRLVSKYPELVSKIVAVGCPCKPELGQGGQSNPELVARRKKAYQDRDIDTLVEMLHKRIMSEPGTEELRKRSIELRRKLPAETILGFFDPDPSMDITEVLPDVDIPVQIIHGAEDHQVDVESAHLMASLIPDVRLHFIEHAGHIPMITATREFCDLVKQFINEEVSEAVQS